MSWLTNLSWFWFWCGVVFAYLWLQRHLVFSNGDWRSNSFSGQMLFACNNACCCAPAPQWDKAESSRHSWLWLCMGFYSLSASLNWSYPSSHPAVLLFWQLLKISWNNCKWVIIFHLACMQPWNQWSFACCNKYPAMPWMWFVVLYIWIANFRKRGTELESNLLLLLLL